MTTVSIGSRDKLQQRAVTSSSGFSVRRAEDEIKSLRKENFNLKLKMFLLETRNGSLAVTPEVDELCEKEFIDLVIENDQMKGDIMEMRVELMEKQNLLKSSLRAIEMLEVQKLEIKKTCQYMLLDQRMKTIMVSSNH